MSEYVVPSFQNLIEKFQSLPGVGQKTAQRFAYYIISLPKSEAKSFAEAIVSVKENIRLCKICKNLTDDEICSICSDEKRDCSTICVVESPKDVVSFENSGFNFKYHVLHGVISPLNGISPSEIYIADLVNRIKKSSVKVKEVIMATNPTMEGETTAMYIKKLLEPFNIKITRLACGVPIGGDLQYTDKVTLLRALEGRGEM